MNDRRDLLRESLAAIERLQARLEASENAARAPVAIVGAGCRYPGGVEDPEALWRLVRDGVDAVAQVPADRWDADAYYDADPKAPGKMVTRRGGFLSQVDRFEPQFFGISPREAATMDPQHRLLLETSYEALEQAAIAPDSLVRSSTGVFVGITTGDYGQLMRVGGPENTEVYSATGTALNAAAGRIAFTLGLQGPCIALDTACSSSLVAVHLACQSLRTGECQLALAGGVNVILAPDAMVLYSKWGMIAPDGACKTFDAAADGFVRAEGCAVVALKLLSSALEAGDPILAVIRGSAVNSDGRSSGLTVPNGLAQQAAIRSALANARLQPKDVDYVEAHGTGTPLGDPIEIEALGTVYGEGRRRDKPLAIASIKTNIGHSEAASGIAGLLKVIMQMQHDAIAPHLHFKTANPGIRWQDYAVSVPTRLTPWPASSHIRRAGVSSFGFSGTNAHIIVEEAPSIPNGSQADREPACIFALSARSKSALQEAARRLGPICAADNPSRLQDISTTLALGRTHHRHRAAFVCSSKDTLRDALSAIELDKPPALGAVGEASSGERRKIGFLFTGQGSQYTGMGHRLYDAEPLVRGILDRAANVLAETLKVPLLDVMFNRDNARLLAETQYTQPALFALEYALAELWRSWGVEPAIVAGHSVGEYVAACIAGVFSFEDGLSLIGRRGRLMQELPPDGGMAAVFCDSSRVRKYVDQRPDLLAIAGLNGPEETILSGNAAELDQVLAQLAANGVQSRRLDVSHAFHSPLLEPMLGSLDAHAGSVIHRAPKIQLVSNVSGALFGPSPSYWSQHARQPVNFLGCLEAMKAENVTTIVEVGPQPTLLALVERARVSTTWKTAGSLRRGRDDRDQLLDSLASIYANGIDVRWQAVGAAANGRRISLPTYPFERTRHWKSVSSAAASQSLNAGHSLPGERSDLDRSATLTSDRTDWYYRANWQAKSESVKGPRAIEGGPWLIFADRAGLGSAIAELRSVNDDSTILVKPGREWSSDSTNFTIDAGNASDYRRLVGSINPKVILYLWSAESAHDGSGDDSLQMLDVEQVLRLVQSVRAEAKTIRPRLWFVTSNAQKVVPTDTCDRPDHAMLWGMLRALSAEHAELWGGLIDQERESPIAAKQIIREIHNGDAEDKIAFRQGVRYVPRLERYEPPQYDDRSFLARSDATYLVTGGLGGIGLELARWLVERGAKHLLLLGRSPLPDRDFWSSLDPESSDGRKVAKLEALKELGAEVEAASVDVASREQIDRCVAGRKAAGFPDVRGIIHAAGVLHFEALETLSQEALRAGLAAKVLGAWHLHRKFVDQNLDCFLMCSSSSALLNSPLLGGYAAGNAFLDALAEQRKAQGLNALSINWGTWGQVGMASGEQARGGVLAGFGTITTEQGLLALSKLLASGDAHIAVMPINWPELTRAYPAFATDRFLEKYARSTSANIGQRVSPGINRQDYLALPQSERSLVLFQYLRIQAAQALGLAADELDTTVPLSSLGFDSLMAVQLKNCIELDLGISIPLIRFLEGSSLKEVAPSIQSKVSELLPQTSSSDQLETKWEEGSL